LHRFHIFKILVNYEYFNIIKKIEGKSLLPLIGVETSGNSLSTYVLGSSDSRPVACCPKQRKSRVTGRCLVVDGGRTRNILVPLDEATVTSPEGD
jgi:hypothetical protein